MRKIAASRYILSHIGYLWCSQSCSIMKGYIMPRPRTRSDLSIAELENILSATRVKVARLERKRATLQRKLDAIDGEIAEMGGVGRRGGRVRNDKSLNETLVEVLSKGPMKVADLVAAVKSTGYRSNSANFRGIVNQALIKDKRFVSQSRGLYQLKK